MTNHTGTLAELLAEFGFAHEDMGDGDAAWTKMDGTALVMITDGDCGVPEHWTDRCELTVHGYDNVVKFDGDGFGLADWLVAHDVRQPLESD